MIHSKAFIFALALVIAYSSSAPASSKARERKKGSILIQLKPDAGVEADLIVQLEKLGLTIDKKMFDGRVLKTKIKGSFKKSEEDVIDALRKLNLIESAEVDFLVKPAYVPNDPLNPKQWHLGAINAVKAWDYTLGSSSVKVMVCDAGIESDHPDLINQMALPGINTVDNSTTTNALNMHGTFCAGVIAATADNATGISGIAGRVKVMPGRITNLESGSAYYSDMAECVRWAADNGAKVVNLSYAGAESSTLDQAGQYIRNKGGLLVMAAGNNSADISSTYPDFTSFMAIGAVGRDLLKTTWSNWGSPIDLVAPGVDIYSTQIGKTYAWGWGTSFAAPQVAGAAALLWSINPNFTPGDVEKIIYNSTTDVGSVGEDSVYGKGLLNVGNAVELAMLTPATPQPKIFSAGIGMSLGFKNQQAKATVTVKDSNGFLSSGAIVSVTWSGVVSGSSTGTTNSSGQITLSSPKTSARGTIYVTIKTISKSGFIYDSSLNIETSDFINK